MATAGVDFFRVDRSGSVHRILTFAAVLVAVGVTLVGAHLMHRIPFVTAHLISLGGGLMVLVGLVLGFGSMAMMVFENVYLLFDDEGVTLHENGKETKISWGDLEGVELDADPLVVIFETRADTIRWTAGKSASILREKVRAAKRKADHGLLKPASRAAT